jgi:hypothetical protein
MIYIPPTRDIHLHHISNEDPLQNLTKTLNDFQNNVDNARAYFYGSYGTQSQQKALECFNQAYQDLPLIQKALPASGSSDEWTAIQNKWGSSVANQIHEFLYNTSPSIDQDLNTLHTALQTSSIHDDQIQKAAEWIKSITGNVISLVNQGQPLYPPS